MSDFKKSCLGHGMFIYAMVLALTACGSGNTDEKDSSSTSGTAITQTQKKPAATAARSTTPPDPVANGKRMFRACAACHTANEGGQNRVGPNLYAIYGAPAGQKDGFSYSKAMIESGIVWNEETLDGYLADPRGYIPNNRMVYPGLKDVDKRAAVIAYLKSISPEAP